MMSCVTGIALLLRSKERTTARACRWRACSAIAIKKNSVILPCLCSCKTILLGLSSGSQGSSIKGGDPLMDKQRRKFLKIAGVTALAGIGAPALIRLSSASALASEHGAAEGPAAEAVHGAVVEAAPKGMRLGMVIDMRKFSEQPELLDNAIVACNDAHNIPQFDNKKSEIKWIWKAPFENVFPTESSYHLAKNVEKADFAVLCNHCDNPPCVRACPTQATFKAKNGICLLYTSD